MLLKILFVLRKKIYEDGGRVDIVNLHRLKDLEQNIDCENLEKHNEGLLLKGDLDGIIILFHI